MHLCELLDGLITKVIPNGRLIVADHHISLTATEVKKEKD